MNDRYLYRGKRIDTGEWVEGSLVTGVFFRLGQEIPYMFCPNLADYDCFEDFSEENGIFEVDPSTICQCTGLKDKKGKLIWEHDIVTFAHEKCTRNYVIEFEKTFYNYGLRFRNKSTHFRCTQATLCTHDCEVIGNSIDNPELLEV